MATVALLSFKNCYMLVLKCISSGLYLDYRNQIALSFKVNCNIQFT